MIAASTGGPDALNTLFSELPGNLAKSILVVQHIPTSFISKLADRLNRNSKLQTVIAREGMLLEPGKAFLIEEPKHLAVEDNKIHFLDTEPEESCKPSANVLFRSAVENFANKTLGVVLTGMGKDGFDGCKAIDKADGYIIAQDERSCKVFGMPSFPIKAGISNEILPPNEIGKRIVELLGVIS